MDKRGSAGWRYPCISMTTTDIEIAQEVQRLCGGSITIVRESRARKPHWKQAWRWAISGAQKALGILEEITPLLRCPKKKRRAEHLLGGYLSIRNGAYTDEDKEKKVKFQEEFFAL